MEISGLRIAFSILCNNLYGKKNRGMYITADSLCCTPEINTILYVNYTSIKFFLKNHKNKMKQKKIAFWEFLWWLSGNKPD